MEGNMFPPGSPAAVIIDYVQRNGEATVRELTDLLGVSATAVREHLTHLQAKKLLDTRLVRKGPGRPHLVYFLTPQAQSLFPKAYDSLITMLLREIMSREGLEGTQQLLDAVSQRPAAEYSGQITGAALEQRLAELRVALEARGIPARVQPSSEGLQLFACPYLDVAQEHASVCTMERRMLEQLLGQSLQIGDTIREGHKSCHFSVAPRVAEGDTIPLVEKHNPD
jgi:predicted ArsR family transcriptional regulator